MNSALSEFLRESAGQRFLWGRRDCSLWACEWIARHTGRHPAPSLIGTYGTALECARLLRREGGLQNLAQRIAAAAGLPETADPLPGDVVLCRVRENGRHLDMALGICVGRRSVFKAPFGLSAASEPPLVAWRV